VERCLLEHFAVKEAVVVPYPHETWGEAGCAFVVLKPDKQTDNASLDKHAKAHLARFKVPKRFVFMQALPKNDSGKINRMALREMALTETTPTDKP
jgi:acyl-coenzyme A synthetase/AMP-(fatty) acid ligase